MLCFSVSVGLVWGSDKADPELAAEVTRTIGTTILFPDVSYHHYYPKSNCLTENKLWSNGRLNLKSFGHFYLKIKAPKVI